MTALGSRIRRLVGIVVISVLSVAPKPGQAQDWVVTAAAGRLVHESLGSRVGTLGTTLSLGYEGPLSLYLAGGAPFDTSGVFWGAAGAAGRFTRGTTLSVGIDAATDLVTFADASWDTGGWATSLEVMPLARVQRGIGAIELRSGLARSDQRFGAESSGVNLHLSDARVTLASRGLRLDGDLRYARAEDDAYPFAGLTAEYAGPALAGWATLGRWFTSDASGGAWGVGARITAAPVGAIFASYTQEGWDPLYRNAPRRSWNIGLSRSLGSRRSPANLPDTPQVRDGSVLFSVTEAAASGPISIAGDFTGWETVAMEHAEGEWVVTLPVSSGVYRYAFRDGNGDWFVPATVPDRVDDGFGGVSAVLVVP